LQYNSQSFVHFLYPNEHEIQHGLTHSEQSPSLLPQDFPKLHIKYSLLAEPDEFAVDSPESVGGYEIGAEACEVDAEECVVGQLQ